MKVVITGASGLLGRSTVKEFENSGWEVVGTAFSRANDKLFKLDLTDPKAIEEFVEEHNPDVIVHCAAERRPDVAERDQESVLRLNVETPRTLGKICKGKNIMLVYISTDYVFDGTSPPYEVDDKPNPLQFYGKTKLGGEEAIKEEYPNAVILRVPILYGKTEYNSESAINVLIDVVKNREKQATVDNVASRYPTNVEDVGRVIKDLAEAKLKQNREDIKGVYHFTGKECITKYQVCQIIGSILNTPIDHLLPQDVVDSATSVSRPENAHLSVRRLEESSINTSCVKFSEWFQSYLH